MDISNFVDVLSPGILAVSLGIVVLAVAFWRHWNPFIEQTVAELRQLRHALDECDVTGRAAIAKVASQVKNPNIQTILREVESGLFELPGDLGVKAYSLRFYRDIWTRRALLAQRVNLALYEAAPNILIGIGLLFTFLFLAIALSEAMLALKPGKQGGANNDAIKGLLQSASAKFLTSIAGMLCSICWTFAHKRSLEALDDEIESICAALRRHVEDTGSEAAISTQVALLGEILNESRDQVGQLKRFETDFAVAIGRAMGSQMQPAFEQLTASITNALNALTEKVGTMNEDTLRKMLSDFQQAISDHSGQEMEAFRTTLVKIAHRIEEAADKLQGAGGAAGDALKEGGRVLVDGLAGGAGDLRQAAGLLEQAMVTAKTTVNDFDETLERAVGHGRNGLENIQSALSQLAHAATGVASVVETIRASSADFQGAATSASKATENLQGVIGSQSELVHQLADAATKLGQSLGTVNEEFRSSANTMAETTKTMTSGVEEYSQKVANLHIKLDEGLAKAINSLNGAVSELVDGLDDFLEELDKGRRK